MSDTRGQQTPPITHVYRTVESAEDKARQAEALRRLVKAGRACVCGASEGLVNRRYYIGGDGYRSFAECEDGEACQTRQRGQAGC